MITKATQRKFENDVQNWTTYRKQHHMKSYYKKYPRLMFTDGVSSTTEISAGTKVGILFAVVVAALTKPGREILLNDAKLTKKS